MGVHWKIRFLGKVFHKKKIYIYIGGKGAKKRCLLGRMGGGVGSWCPNGHYDHDFPKVLNQIINVTLYNNSFTSFISFDPNFKHNRYNTTDFLAEQTCPQNAERDNFLSCNKKFVEKIDTNLALWRRFLWQIFTNQLFIDSLVTIILFWKTIKNGKVLQYRCIPLGHSENQRQLESIFSIV